jgi:hypothetical protein
VHHKAINLVVIASVALAVAASVWAAPQPKKALRPIRIEPLPSIPQSTFSSLGRSPFLLSADKGPFIVGRITDEQFAAIKESLRYTGQEIKGGQSWALINERLFFLNVPSLLDPSRPDFQVVATMIDEKRVVLRLLDGTGRIIELLYRPSQNK